ncbi:LPXTG cell wall anchor domain protein [Streptococcus mitis]|uniref:SEC10/PgrA surface exclusion domain-containing protein n=1 Tax=Streptococcus mitis TaxID=28037 RepID=UPI0004D6CEC4|nr:SEC10/PgrA surface exclusion domain-containing protein [Streptococcus mitis]QBZ13029.1 LPXTG cell wall anchor domain protein [Streptococcus mitis]
MIESNTQGHGTIKKLRTGAVVSTLALTAFGVSTGVSANETEVAVNEPATRVVAKDDVKPKVSTQQDVDKAKAESDKASQDVAKQKEVVSTTEANIANVEKTIADTTKKTEEAKSVTPEKVAEAKADAEKKANELATAEKTVADADKSVSTTAEKVADQTKVVSNAEKTATATANKVADAQKKVDSLSSTTDVAPLEKKVATLTNKVKTDTQAVSTAQTNLDNAKKAQSNKEQAVKDSQTRVSSAEAQLSQATTALANAKADQSNKDKAVTTAKSALEVAKQGVTETTTSSETMYDIPKATYSPALSQGYIDAIKALANGAGTTDAVDTAVYEVPYADPKYGATADSLNDFNSTGTRYYKGQYIPYGAEDTDATEIADFQHLTKDQQIRLTTYAASIVNELRAKFGTKPVTVGDSSLKLAEAFNNNANGYVAGNSGEYNPLNNQTLSLSDKLNMAKKTANTTGSALAVRTSSIPHFLGLGENLTTMARIKQVLYSGIVNTLMGGESNTGSEDRFSGALSLLGLRDADKTILGVGIGAMISQLNKGYEASITLSAPQSTTATTKKVDEKAVKSAQKAYNEAVKASQESKTAVKSAQTTYTNAETALANARTNLSNVVGNKIDVPALEKALADAKDKLAQDTKALQTAKESLALAKSNATDKAKALADAKSALETAKAEQSTANQSLATAKGELEVLTKAHDVAVLARKSAGQDLARKREASKEASDIYTVLELALTKRDEVLKALDKELTDANAKLGVLRAELKTAKDELARLEGIAEAKARGYENFKQLKADHDAYLAEQQRLQALKDKKDAIVQSGGEVKPVLDADGKVVDVVDAKAQNKAVVATVGTKGDKTYQAPAKATNVKAEPKKQLPNTGEKHTNTATLAIITALSSIGLVYRKRKKSQ